jgi:hypothetical protein
MARTNARGVTVRIDARGPSLALGMSSADPRFVAQEAVFYGNLWADPPQAFACMGTEAVFGMFGGRVCSDGATCGFQRVREHCQGLCSFDHQAAKECDGSDRKYKAPITVFLDPHEFAAECPPGCTACMDGVCNIASAGSLRLADETIACPDGMDCKVWCIGKDSCKESLIQGPADHEVAIECHGEQACEKVVLGSGAVGSMSCQGKESCKAASASCSRESCDVAVVCNGERACRDADFLYEGTASALDVDCDGKEACKDVSVECGSGTCDVACGVGEKVCEHLSID